MFTVTSVEQMYQMNGIFNIFNSFLEKLQLTNYHIAKQQK